MSKTIQWMMTILEAMGNAMFHPFRENSPPKIGVQPFKDDPYKQRGIA